MLIKQLWMKGDTTKRDKLLPIIAFVANFLTRLGADLAGGTQTFGLEGSTSLAPAVLLAGFFDSAFGGVLRMIGVAGYDTLLSWGLHRAKRYGDVIRGSDSKPRPVSRKR